MLFSVIAFISALYSDVYAELTCTRLPNTKCVHATSRVCVRVCACLCARTRLCMRVYVYVCAWTCARVCGDINARLFVAYLHARIRTANCSCLR